MVIFDKFLNFFCSHAAVVNDDSAALKKEVEIVKEKYGKWVRVKGFTSYKELFLALRMATAKKNPYVVAFLRENEKSAGEFILKQTAPTVKTYKYSDTTNLSSLLPTIR